MDHEFYDLFDNFSITKHQITEATNHLLSEKVQKRKKSLVFKNNAYANIERKKKYDVYLWSKNKSIVYMFW